MYVKLTLALAGVAAQASRPGPSLLTNLCPRFLTRPLDGGLIPLLKTPQINANMSITLKPNKSAANTLDCSFIYNGHWEEQRKPY